MLTGCLEAPTDSCVDLKACTPQGGKGGAAGTDADPGASAQPGAGGAAGTAGASVGGGGGGEAPCPAAPSSAPFAFEAGTFELPQAGGVVSVAIGDTLIVSFKDSNDLVAVNLSTGAAQTLPPPPSGPVHHPALVVVGERFDRSTIYVLGGAQGQPLKATSHVQAFDVAEGAWLVLPSLKEPTYLATAFEHERRLIVAGGSLEQGTMGKQSLHELDLTKGLIGQWRALEPLPEPRQRASGVKLDGRYYVLGGAVGWDDTLGATGASGALVYDIAHDTWEKLPPPPTPRAEAAVAVMCGQLLLVGGRSGGPQTALRAVEALDPVSKAWATMPALGAGRSNPAAFVRGAELWVVGGASSSAPSPAEIGRFVSP